MMRSFAVDRPLNIRSYFYNKFALSGSASLIISRNNPAWGKVFTNTVEIKKNGSTNVFFKDIPIHIKALPMPGYKFVRWEGISTETSPEIFIVNNSNSTLTAVFEPAELTITSIVINEINYKSAAVFDTEDWVELYNPVNDAIDISGWKFSDDNIVNQFTFPGGSILEANDYLVLCRDTVKFKLLHPDQSKILGDLSFGLSSNGDHIMLKDYSGNMIDEVTYLSDGLWTSLPNGNGPTLSLINPQLDNSLAESWRASSLYGTPGYLNDIYTKTELENDLIPTEFVLYQNYPNPFNPSTSIQYAISSTQFVTLKVYDLLGKEVATLVNEEKPAGTYKAGFNRASSIKDLVSGIYFYRL